MPQFLRPDSNLTQTSFTGGFAEIDETSFSDTDFAYGANNTAAVLEVHLSNPTGTPGAGTTTVRYRIGQVNAGVLDGTGNAVTITAAIYQGATLIASDTVRTATGTWTTYTWTPSMASVTDWTDLRLRFTTSASGGSPANRRGGAISWAELEAPSANYTIIGETAGYLAKPFDTGLTFFTTRYAAFDAYTSKTYDGSSAYTYDYFPLGNAYTLTLTTIAFNTDGTGFVPPLAGGTKLRRGYTLTGTIRTYSATGVSSILKSGRKVIATLRTYSATAVNSILIGGRRITGTPQTYSASGVSSVLRSTRKLVATQQTYSASGISSILKAGRKLLATQQAYSATGVSSILSRGVRLTASVRTHSVTGVSSALRTARRLVASQQSYSLSGVSAGVLAGRRLTATQGSYSLSTLSALLKRGTSLSVTKGTFTLTTYPSALSFTTGRRVFIVT